MSDFDAQFGANSVVLTLEEAMKTFPGHISEIKRLLPQFQADPPIYRSIARKYGWI